MCFFGFLSGVSVGKMILYSQKKSQIQFPVFETKYHPRYHSNWHKAPLLRIQSYTPQGNGCGLRQFLLSLLDFKTTLKSPFSKSVHTAIPPPAALCNFRKMLTPLFLRFILLAIILILFLLFVNILFYFSS